MNQGKRAVSADARHYFVTFALTGLVSIATKCTHAKAAPSELRIDYYFEYHSSAQLACVTCHCQFA